MKAIKRVLPFLIATHAVHAQDAEQIFAEALNYTVRVKTTIPTPFHEDEKGVFTGAGFIVDAGRRWVLTNAHVVGRSPSTVRIAVYGEEYEEAKKVYVDPYVDVAVVELAREIPAASQARLLCEDSAGTGHPVGAFGHPWGFDYTGTQGVISGRTPLVGGDLLQTDAPINGGNSGGPLISLKSGGVVGISTASFNDEEDQNTNFAVPISHACKILALLKAGTDPSPPDLKVIFFDRGDTGLPLVVGRSYVPREQLDLQPGDEILSASGSRVTNEGELTHLLRGNLDNAEIGVVRSGQRAIVRGRLPPLPRVTDRRGVLFSGVLLAPGGMRDAAALGLGHDIMVQSVDEGSEGAAAELYVFDYVVAVEGVPVRDLEHLYSVLAALPVGQPASLDFLRAGTTEDEGRVFALLRREIIVTAPTHFGAWSD